MLPIHISQLVLNSKWLEIHSDIRESGLEFGVVLFLDDRCWLQQAEWRQMLLLHRWWLPFKHNQCKLKTFPTCQKLKNTDLIIIIIIIVIPSWCNKPYFYVMLHLYTVCNNQSNRFHSHFGTKAFPPFSDFHIFTLVTIKAGNCAKLIDLIWYKWQCCPAAEVLVSF